jgi:folate-binding protein YgfZ
MSEPIRLDDRAVIAVNGPEARSFLQGLITNDIENVAPGRAIYAALLTPQGKILFDFFIVEGDGALLIDCHRQARDALIKRLSMYRLRAKVQIEARDQLAVLVGLTGRPAGRGVTFEDPRLPELGHRSIGATAEMPSAVAGASAYHAHRLALGVPETGDFGSDRMFALDADLDDLHAISFGKGCYVGQELTARMKHRGTARKRLLVVEGVDGTIPPAGTELRANGHVIGEIVSVHGARGFALVRLDRLEEAKGAPVDANGSPVAVTKQDWLKA